MEDLNQLTATDISQRLRQQGAPTHDVPLTACREAGVLVPFVRVGESWHLLFIRRPASERDYHSGQVAFAGGKRDPEDPDLTATALREAHEEIGILPQDVQILGQLSPHHSVSRFRIAPVVATLPWPYNLIPSPQEVARAFTIPLQWLAQPEHHEIHYRQLADIEEPVPVVYFQEYDNEMLWGATARITLSLLDCLRK
ncbi:MAG: CoA pyrophosphatase [Gammaproteobacteria bacterium]|nr:CoA pyrophosphatase [Gammaproteobacteria bacterium]MBU1724639.1 CoA pyrophosphatase [Gammaproteobacteria bacterium]MBU2005333.1 CoA pyrophosphatase [Gammaproteobacteria bacterium]